MELKHNNPNNEIVLASKLNLVQKENLKFFENCILKDIFLGRCLNCLKNKIALNLLITSPNNQNQSFTCEQKYGILGKRNLNFILTFCDFFLYYLPNSILGFL